MAYFLTIILCVIVLWVALGLSYYIYQKQNTSKLHKTLLIPYLGYWPLLGPRPYETFTDLAQKLGSVFSIQVGNRNVVLLNSEDAVKKAFSSAALCGRPDFPCWRLFLDHGIRSRFTFRSQKQDPACKYLRKTAVKAVAHFHTNHSDLIKESSLIAAKTLRERLLSSPTPLTFETLNVHVFNSITIVMGTLCFGKDFDAKDPLLNQVVSRFEGLSYLLSIGNPIDYLPFGDLMAKIVLPFYYRRIVRPLNKYIDKLVGNHYFDKSLKTFTNFFQNSVLKTTESELVTLGITERTVWTLSYDLFAGGSPTTSNTIIWTILLLASYPDVQEELRNHLCHHDFPVCEQNCYLEMVILEVLRFSSLVPLNLPHAAVEDAMIEGVFVPKGSVILANFWKIHHDKEYFSEPFEFKPKRFLDQSTNKINPTLASKVNAFGVGIRRCPGERLAKEVLSLVLEDLVRNGVFELSPQQSYPINLVHTCRSGIVRSPPSFSVCYQKC